MGRNFLNISGYFGEFEEVVVIDKSIQNLLVSEKILGKSGKPFYLFFLNPDKKFDFKNMPEIISLDNITHVSEYFWDTKPKRLFLYGPSVSVVKD